MPSDLVVMQNFVGDKTQGVIEQVNAHYTLLPRGAYAETAGRHTVLRPITRDEQSPLELYEAQNAVQIAEAAGAGTYAADTLATAKTAFQNAQDIDTHRKNRKEAITFAREAVQSAEDARIITIRKIKAADEAAAQQARVNAEQTAQQAQLVAEQQAQQRAQAQAAATAAQAQAESAREAEQQASQQAAQARERLREQLNQVLQTTESARGLIVNMSDVLFDFNKYTLKPEAREKLAKVSGILLAYPNLKLQVEGYTDNIGSDEYNLKLSEERADGVRNYLVAQSVADTNVTARGLGKRDPVADNSTDQGRAKNRRVELVVSGAAIGVEQSAAGAQSQSQPTAGQRTQGNTSQATTTENNLAGTSNPHQ
jgi:outer membrane protein OmpA-like peptidoglycan-associated protein